ncbi:Protein phosphatase methylesterase 1 [Terramyces sp. JEL0728]|nr:Protein phosphatase methylesterase 1 [Terramyces sp. JEL0728]KAJ3271813.1 Protein phosphatase methylesterase 1 [Terramyces sp. JEL0728]
MGAPVVISAMPRLKKVVGIVVLDVVEGTAIESLGMMTSILMRRPKSFKSKEDAIEWSLKSGGKNLESLKVSVPGQLRNVNGKYYWRTDLESSKIYWQGWFENMSEKFLSCKCAKLLVLAGADRLDKPLMIGQMQGKFQLIIIPESGHLIQEDVPEKLAVIIDEFYKRNQPLDITKIRKPLQ